MYNIDLEVIREYQKYRYETVMRLRRGYYYSTKSLARRRADGLLARLQHLFASISERLKVQQLSEVRLECVLNPVEC